MKSIIYLCCIAATLFSDQSAWAQTDGNNHEQVLSTPGTKLKWENNSSGKSYFYININNFNLAENNRPLIIDVDFSMSMNESMKGNIIIQSDALKNSTKMHNYFKPGGVVLNDKTSVWLSKKVSALMKKGTAFELEIKEGKMVKFNKFADVKFKINKKDNLGILDDDEKVLEVDAIKASNAKGDFIIMHNSQNNSNPLILSMKLPGLNLTLIEFEEARFSFNSDWPGGN